MENCRGDNHQCIVDHLKGVQLTQSLEGRGESSSLDADSTTDDWDSNLGSTSDNFQATEPPRGTDTTSVSITVKEPPNANTSHNDTSEIETASTDPI